jgi:hypothetical protein
MFKLSNPECGRGSILENTETNATLVCPAFVTASCNFSIKVAPHCPHDCRRQIPLVQGIHQLG